MKKEDQKKEEKEPTRKELEKEKEILATVTKNENDQKSQATRIRDLIVKQKGWIKSQQSIIAFKEPVLFLQRRTGQIEFYEAATKGIFEFQHSDGEQRYIMVNPSTQVRFSYGSHSFKGYTAHEDYPITGWPDPLITTEQMNIIVEKSINDIKKWKAQELKAKGEMYWKILGGIAVIIMAIALFKMLAPTKAAQIATIAANQTSTIISVVNQTAQNAPIIHG